MQGSQFGWWRRHGWTVAILLGAFGAAFAIRTIWTYPIIEQFGPLYSYAGGSDSYYHSRVATYIILNHRNLVYDPLIHFPVGGYNPREPLFDWMNAVLGLAFAPFFGGNAVTAGAWFLDLQAPLWAALGVFPIYLIGREVSSKRVGLIAAVIFPFLSANIDSSIFGYANYLSFYTFVILITLYSYIRTVKAVGSRRWVESYAKPGQYLPALRAFLRTERTAVKWAVFTGVCLGALALAWQGYTYAIAVMGVSLVVIMIIERIRRVDSFGLYVSFWITGLVWFPMAVPYYLVQHQFSSWFDLPLLLYFGTLALMLVFLVMRDIPWVFSIPALVALVAAAGAFLAVFEPRYFTSIVTGQGYLVKNLIYSTVAEDVAPSIDQLVVGYGVITFFLAFAGIALVVYSTIRARFKRYQIAFLVFAVLSIYLPISAAKFFLLGSPAFALLPAEAIDRALRVGGYPELRRTVASLSDRRSQFAAFRKAFKARHVLILALVVGLILPNIWVSIDAGIPGNSKSQYSSQVYNTLPSFLKGNSSTSGNYFGAAGTSIDTANQYDSAGYNWLATQDTSIPEPDRPALVSWWDYGFQTIDQGQHPSVADNFQDGIDPAGQFLLAQNESTAIAILAVTLLQAEQSTSGKVYLPAALNTILAGEGLNVSQFHNLLVNQSYDYSLVVANPSRYLPVDPTTLTDGNAMYMATSYFIATSLSVSGVASLYNAIQSYTGWSIRYDLTDSRLIPFSGTDTGIFYAPAELTGRIISPAGLPSTYFNVTVLGSNGNTYPLGDVPADVSPINYYVNYFAPFYNSMIYRTYFGYNGTDVGQSIGIPGLEGSIANDPIEPGWMLQHFEVVYKTAYYCANATEAARNPSCYTAMNQPNAISLAKITGGLANTSAGLYFSGGESMLEYYPGQTVLGEVRLASGAPVGGLRVTVSDSWGIPHMTAITAPDGAFTLVLPPGNDTLNVSTGALQGLTQQGLDVIQSVHLVVSSAVALSLSAPTLPLTITIGSSTVSGTIYWNAANSTSYDPTTDPVVAGAEIVLWGPNNVTRIITTTDASGTFELTAVPLGVYNYDVIYGGHNYTQTPLDVITPSPSTVNATVGLATGTIRGVVRTASGAVASGAVVTLGNSSGVVVSNVAAANGSYRLTGYGGGNYTLGASLPGTTLRSAGVPVVSVNESSKFEVNLTIEPTVSVSIAVSASGAPAAGIPIRVSPQPEFANSSVLPLAALASAANASMIALTGANGVASVALPYGNYSLSAVGYIAGRLYAGSALVSAPAGSLANSVALGLSPAVSLSGTVAPVGTFTSTTRVAVIAYAADGTPTYAWAVNGTFRFYLPSGTYSLLALQGVTSGSGTLYAALQSVSLSSPTTASLSPSTAVSARFVVGATFPKATVPAAGAQVTITAGSSGPAVTAFASANGTTVAFVPEVVPTPATSYCLAVRAPGFSPTSECGISPSGIAALSRVPLTLAPVSVSVRVLGGPAGAVYVNATGTSPGATGRTLYGGSPLTFTATAGTYSFTGWAPTSNVSVLYRETTTVNVTVPLGAASETVTLRLAVQRNSTGTLALPSGGKAALATVGLSSASFNATVNGTAFTSSGFYAPAGNYSAYASITVGGTAYAQLQFVTIGPNGKVTPKVTVSAAAVTVNGTLEATSGAVLAVSTPVALVASSGALATTQAIGGNFTVELPAGAAYGIRASATTTEVGTAGSYLVHWVASPSASCPATAGAALCAVPMVPTTQLVWLNGTLSAPGVPGPISGTVRLTGPSPYDNVTTVSATNGTFSVQLLPGTYSVYVAGGGASSPLAALVTEAVSLETVNPVGITLSPSWTVTVTAAAPTAASPLLGPANVTLSNAVGARIAYPGVVVGAGVSLALPLGTYTATADSFGAPFGVPSPASATAPVTVAHGNVAVGLALSYVYSYSASATIAGANSTTVTSPGSATFSFAVRNTGNAPLAIHPVGSPANWGFTFSFANATILPGSAPLAGSVAISVPSLTSTLHPPVVLAFAVGNGSTVASVTPTVAIVPYYGVSVGARVSSAAQVGTGTVRVPFYVTNDGNVPETVALSVVDLPRVNGLGWTASFRSTSAELPSATASLAPYANSTFFLQLNATAPVFVPPGEVTVQASVMNQSGAYQAAAELPVPIATLKSPTVTPTPAVPVTGPSVSTGPSGLPDWVVPLVSFVPAIALVVGVITYRWWRTRRWTRR